MSHIRQSRPDSGPVFQADAIKTVYVVPFSLGSGIVHSGLPGKLDVHVSFSVWRRRLERGALLVFLRRR